MVYRSNFDKFRRELYAVVNERANRIANEVSAEVVKVFVNRAKDRLEKAKRDFTPESASMISSVKDNIYYESEPYFTKSKTTDGAAGAVPGSAEPADSLPCSDRSGKDADRLG